MSRKIKIGNIKKRLLRSVVYVSLASILITVSAQPAQAQTTTFDPWNYALQTASWAYQQLQTAWAGALTSANANLTSQIATLNTDSASVATRTSTTDVKTAQEIGLRYADPSGKSACSIAQRGAADADRDVLATAEHQGLAGGGPALATPSDETKILVAAGTSGLRNCNGSDPQSQFNKAAGCNDPFNGQFNGLDLYPSAIAADGPYQIPVPPNFQLPKNGVAMPIPQVTDGKYMPFVAAYNYCRNISPRIPKPYQPVNGTLTVDAVGMTNYIHTETIANTAYDTCIDLLIERMQHGANSSIAAFNNLHTDEVTICQSDFTNGIIDQAALTACQTDGRSKLQAMYDWANRAQSSGYHNIFRNIHDLSVSDQERDMAEASSDLIKFKQMIKGERNELINAIGIGLSASPPAFSPLAAPVSGP